MKASTPIGGSAAQAVPSSPSTDDFTLRYGFWLFPVFLLVAFTSEIERALDTSSILLLLLIPGLIVFWLAGLAYTLWRRRWWRLISLLLAPALAVSPLILSSYFGITPTWVHFKMVQARYEREVARTAPLSNTLRLRTFDWGTIGSALVSVSYTLVYDESDEIGRPPAMRSARWQEQARQDPSLWPVISGTLDITITPLGSHFYELAEVL